MKNNRLQLSVLFLFISMLIGCTSDSEAESFQIRSVYMEIDMEAQYQIIEDLESENPAISGQAISEVLANPNAFTPPVLYALANTLFQNEEKDQAAFWFYVGQLRARVDANLCKDKSARQMVTQLNNMFGFDINQYTFQDIEKLKVTVDKVVDYVKTNPENYDHRWIALHGVWLLDESKNDPIIEPEQNWSSIKTQTIDKWYNDFLTLAYEPLRAK